MNSPLRYSDPTGEFVPILIAVGVGAALDLGWQYFVEGKSLACVDWTEVGISGGLGAIGGNWLKPALKLSRFRHGKS